MNSRRLLMTEMPFRGNTIGICCLTKDLKIIEARCERRGSEYLLGGIYIGRVQRVLKNINAAFVDISPSVSCYYSIREDDVPLRLEDIISCQSRDAAGIKDRQIKAGDEILVMVNKDALKSKEPSVTGRLEIPGRYCIVKLGSGSVGVSAKLPRSERDRFHRLLDGRIRSGYDVIVRTNAVNISDDELKAEIASLYEKLDIIIKNAPSRITYSCLYRPDPEYVCMIGSARSDEIDEIVTDIPSLYEKILAGNSLYPDIADIPVRLYEDSLLPMYKLYSIEKQLEDALKPRVWLRSGGYLVIEKTEALTSIDVNTGKSVSKKATEEHFFRVNMEAALEIAYQLRLRNISGIIIVDFINMKDKEHTKSIIETVKHAVRTDSEPVTVHDMTTLGLLEMTRKKQRKSLSEQLT